MTHRAVLTYHAIDDLKSPISIAPRDFRRHIESLAASGIRVVPLAELQQTPEPAVSLTFDDGYQSLLTEALPVLRKHGMPATVFLIASALDGRTFEKRPCLTAAQVDVLCEENFSVGAHTMTHLDLASLTAEETKGEILDSKRVLEDRLGRPVEEFCYPFGSSTVEVREFVREHFKLACSTELDYLSTASRRESLERLDTYYFRNRALDQLFNRSTRAYVGFRRFLRRCRRRGGNFNGI